MFGPLLGGQMGGEKKERNKSNCAVCHSCIQLFTEMALGSSLTIPNRRSRL